MSLIVLKPGLHTTIQDYGRIGVQNLGIPVSGFMDVASAQIANRLVDNSKKTALIECCQLGCDLQATMPMSIAFYGADMPLLINGKKQKQGKVLQLKTDDVLSIGYAKSGVYGYLAIAGEIDVPEYLNSKSTYTIAKLGGFKGRVLKKGDVLAVRPKILESINSKVKQQVFSNQFILSVLKGPEWDDLPKKGQEQLLCNEFKISKDTNRIGYRLLGDAIAFELKKEIISSSMIKGTVQITSSGQPIIMMSDAPTVGGYLRVLNLTLLSCDQLAQAVVGTSLKFELIL